MEPVTFNNTDPFEDIIKNLDAKAKELPKEAPKAPVKKPGCRRCGRKR